MQRVRQPLLLLLSSSSLAQPVRLRTLIVGGHEAKPHSRPYMATLKTEEGYNCGGFLVDPQWVMTAAHCFDDMTVVLGAHDLSDIEDCQQVIGVESYHIHPEYCSFNTSNDILLLKLAFKAVLNKYVQPVRLPKSSSDLPGGTPCSLAGWGLIDEYRKTEKLYETNITIYSRQKCLKFYPVLNDGMICAGSQQQLRDTSQGDSGGPMVCNGVAQGIVSFGNDFPPGVYTGIAAFLPWIHKTMES
ncbi:mast cell protease 1A-like [Rhineura floridana]|uniref:mast cell protease 1A-like n=1 Tax=Rhineura floridana TaxID=261503 RepID=UPI002AC83EDC|nr:mast cell protease 1A-like [Rhineura floridana]